jgi:hypothetical protein
MRRRSATIAAAVGLLFAGLMVPNGSAQQSPGLVKARQLTGLAGVKKNAKGTLNVENAKLHFAYGKEAADLGATSMEDVVTGADSQRSIGGTVGLISQAVPYGGGRFLSLFRTKIDTLTIRYRDADGALHGAIFTMPVGAAEGIKKGLVAQGAHTSVPVDQNTPPASPSNPPSKEQK